MSKVEGREEQAGAFVLLGTIVKAHGVRGDLKVFPYTEKAENLLAYKELFLTPSDSFNPLKRKQIQGRVQGKFVLLTLEQCADRNTAEALAGQDIYIRRSALPELDEHEWYLFELQGKKAVADGQEFGIIRNILPGTGHDLVQILSAEGKEILIPLVDEFIVAHETDKVVFDLPPGLLAVYI